MIILYNLGILVFNLFAHLLAPFNSKARLWVDGRKNWEENISAKIKPGDRTVWIHCASLGEFEQGRPFLEAIKSEIPDLKVVLTFFSPSGYTIRKNYPIADYICYLPVDTEGNAKKFIHLVNPEFVVFVKYEFWNNYISELYKNGVPLYLISAIFRPGQHFFKWYGSFFRGILKKFKIIFVQDEHSLKLLSGIGAENILLAGDTRFDRVAQITGTAKEIPELKQFIGDEKMFLAGSSWRQDEEIISQYINKYADKMKWVFAPHEIYRSNIDRLEKLFNVATVRFSEFSEEKAAARVMILDNMGMLSSAYKYAYIAAVGGGFGKGIHNILEPACWGIPVMFGPRYGNFREAVELIIEKGAMKFESFREFSTILDKWLSDDRFYLKSARSSADYTRKNTGATNFIIKEILQKDINKSGS